MRALGPTDAFRESWRLFRQRPVATLALGLAVLTSLVAVCCLLGVFAAPWFLCELFAVQIALGSGQRPARTRAWLWAGFVQMVAVMLLCAVVGLTLLTVGPDVMLGGSSADTARLATGVAHSLLVWIVAGSLTLALSVYFEHAPALLLDRGGGFSTALLESARVVADSGVLRTWFTSGVAHALSLGPIVLGVTIGAAFGTLSSTVLWGLLLLPLAALSLALGQGMVVASYLALRDATVDVVRLPTHAAVAPRALLWCVLLFGVLGGPVAVTAALLSPTVPAASVPEDAGETLLTLAASDENTQRFIPDSGVELTISKKHVHIDAGGGGGAGAIPLGGARVEAVRIRRVPRGSQLPALDGLLSGSVFALDIRLAGGRSITTWIDEAGVRLDDSFERRLSALLPSLAIAALAGCLVWTAVWIGLSLPPQGRLRKRLTELWLSGERGAPWAELDRALFRKALVAALWLAPAALGSLAIGLWAALGGGNLRP